MKRADKELEIILNDKVHGSSELLSLICQHFLKYQDNIDYVQQALVRIKKNLSHFPVIINFTKEVENILSGKKQGLFYDFLGNFNKKKNEVYQAIFKKASKYLLKHKTVLTISHSNTLIKIFELWKKSNPNLKVIVCESRPNQEGLLMAKELLSLKIETETITEGMAGKIIKDVDVIIFGADQVLRNGSIINKTGSRMLAILARYQKIPVFVFSTSDKTVNEIIIHDENKAASIKSKRLKLRNENFEEIENKLITKIFTD
jgi:translation initiation factor 2B subunit (eIF-2B alpha/beta/delta family)